MQENIAGKHVSAKLVAWHFEPQEWQFALDFRHLEAVLVCMVVISRLCAHPNTMHTRIFPTVYYISCSYLFPIWFPPHPPPTRTRSCPEKTTSKRPFQPTGKQLASVKASCVRLKGFFVTGITGVLCRWRREKKKFAHSHCTAPVPFSHYWGHVICILFKFSFDE